MQKLNFHTLLSAGDIAYVTRMTGVLTSAPITIAASFPNSDAGRRLKSCMERVCGEMPPVLVWNVEAS